MGRAVRPDNPCRRSLVSLSGMGGGEGEQTETSDGEDGKSVTQHGRLIRARLGIDLNFFGMRELGGRIRLTARNYSVPAR